MSNKLTYIEARDKIWNAYFRDEIEPNLPEFCFCGSLCGGSDWYNVAFKRHFYFAGYKGADFVLMETALFKPILKVKPSFFRDDNKDFMGYEDALFNGMLAALEVLKQIHRERGEVIPEDEQPLTKRILQTTNQ